MVLSAQAGACHPREPARLGLLNRTSKGVTPTGAGESCHACAPDPARRGRMRADLSTTPGATAACAARQRLGNGQFCPTTWPAFGCATRDSRDREEHAACTSCRPSATAKPTWRDHQRGGRPGAALHPYRPTGSWHRAPDHRARARVSFEELLDFDSWDSKTLAISRTMEDAAMSAARCWAARAREELRSRVPDDRSGMAWASCRWARR